MTRNRQRRGALAIAIAAFAGIAIATPSSASGGSGDASGFTATPLTEAGRDVGAKSTSGRLAQTDPTLVGRTDATPVNVVVKLDYDATASYAGDIEGLAATSPAVTGTDLTGATPAEVAYEDYTGDLDAQFRADLAQAVPAADAGVSLTRVYGGVAVTVPANKVDEVLALPNVAAVQVDSLEQVQTDSSTTFIGAPSLWALEGGQDLAGQGVIFGDLDTGVWPEHPSFADNGVLGAPPAKADGTARTCEFGDNPLTPATDVFVCNNKLIGGEPFLDTYNAVQGGEVYTTARDSGGHGTHTASTAAGNYVASAQVFGVERGPISGVAPGAWVIEYKVCGAGGCFASDSANAVAQAILDGVSVINFSIGGGANPYTDVAELAFLDAYDAGVLVATSAGNDGPGAATTEHVAPWTITVAASTQTRAFQSTLTLTGDDGTSTELVGSSITAGIAAATPVVLAQNLPGNTDKYCGTALGAGTAAGVIVACQRGNNIGRVQKGFNVLQGGAAGMILYNLPLQDTETDNHFLPTVHLADGTDFLAFMGSHTGVTGSFTDAVKGEGLGDVMAAFSCGPGGNFLKPDITAPGVQILAGHTPTPDSVDTGPAGQYYQAIAGTSMSSPHIAGSALLMKALHPDWTPGAIKSALMTTANENVLKEDEVTPADPFDDGAGRVDLEQAGKVKLVFDETAANMAANGEDPLTALDINTPSINVPTMPGSVTVTRTLTNTTDKKVKVDLSAWSPWDAQVTISPKKGTVPAGGTFSFDVTIKSATEGQAFGSIRIKSVGSPEMHIPVAWFNQQGDVSLTQTCDSAFLKVGTSEQCTITGTNESFQDTDVAFNTGVNKPLKITAATGATINADGSQAGTGAITLEGKKDATPAINPGPSVAGYLPLSLFGINPTPVGDEEAINYNVPPFVFGGKTYNRVGVVSNGYVVLGGTNGSADIDFVPQTLPDPAKPNGLLAPYWTDLDGTGAPGISAGTLTDGVNTWLVLQWNVNLWGTTSARSMQVWIGVNGVEDVSYAYEAGTVNAGTPPGFGLTVGAENESGTGGGQIAGPPAEDYVITTTPGAPGGSASYTLTLTGQKKGGGVVTTNMLSDIVAGTTTVSTNILVSK